LKAIAILKGNYKVEIVFPALRMLGNIVSNSNDSVTTLVVDLGILSTIKKLLKSK
jgi:hypothetical protein